VAEIVIIECDLKDNFNDAFTEKADPDYEFRGSCDCCGWRWDPFWIREITEADYKKLFADPRETVIVYWANGTIERNYSKEQYEHEDGY